MPPVFGSTLFKLLMPLVAIVVVLVSTRKRGMSWTEQIRLVWPSPAQLALWIAVWIVWMWVSEQLISLLGIEQPKPWPAYPALIICMRIFAIGILGPIAEELVFRGVLYYRLAQTRVGTAGTVVVLSAVWASLHVQYGLPLIGMIFVDGLILGGSRWASRSVFVPMILHIIANIYSISQSLGH